jgi:hypothetical protein
MIWVGCIFIGKAHLSATSQLPMRKTFCSEFCDLQELFLWSHSYQIVCLLGLVTGVYII